MSIKLTESTASVRKAYPELTDEEFYNILAIDPTYKAETKEIGQYGPWLLAQWSRGALNEENKARVYEILKNILLILKYYPNASKFDVKYLARHLDTDLEDIYKSGNKSNVQEDGKNTNKIQFTLSGPDFKSCLEHIKSNNSDSAASGDWIVKFLEDPWYNYEINNDYTFDNILTFYMPDDMELSKYILDGLNRLDITPKKPIRTLKDLIDLYKVESWYENVGNVEAFQDCLEEAYNRASDMGAIIAAEKDVLSQIQDMIPDCEISFIAMEGSDWEPATFTFKDIDAVNKYIIGVKLDNDDTYNNYNAESFKEVLEYYCADTVHITLRDYYDGFDPETFSEVYLDRLTEYISDNLDAADPNQMSLFDDKDDAEDKAEVAEGWPF